jgi:P4 family phage/plasmid primase-like protien
MGAAASARLEALLRIPAIAQMAVMGNRFVTWTSVPDGKGKLRKIPLQANGRSKAKSNDPSTWSSYEALAHGLAREEVQGPGVMLGQVAEHLWLVGVDLDLALSPVTGEIGAWGQKWIDRLASYTEVSPSGAGVKIFGTVTQLPAVLWDDEEGKFKGKEATPPGWTMPEGAQDCGHDKAEIGVYVELRYFAITGQHLEGTPNELTDITEAFAELAHEVTSVGRSKFAGKAALVPLVDLPPIDKSLPPKLQAIFENDPKLQHAWATGAKLGKGGDLTASGLETSVTIYLARHLSDDDLAEALHHYPYGQLGGGKLGKGEAERRLKRLLEIAAKARENPAGFDLTHDGLALEWGEARAIDARHVALWGKWLFWTGSRWEMDERLVHMTYMRDFLRAKADEVARRAAEEAKAAEAAGDKKGAEGLLGWAKNEGRALRSAPMVANVAGLVRSNPAQAATVAIWDADPWKLNTPAGIVDLKAGVLGPSDPLAHCTKSTAVAPAPKGTPTPTWDAFLKRIFRHDPELIPFMQRVLGYGLTGLMNEHALIFAWGQGGNGKGVLLNTASGLLGDYAAVAPADLLLVTQSDRHPCDMAMLRGARFVTAQELAPGRAWDEPKLKSLTGGDPITARFMRQDFFTYQPAFLLAVAGNHKPSFKGVDEAIRRRLLLVPFLQNIPAEERDKDLPEKLRKEWPGILRWMIEGCLAWQKHGLNPPETVRAASEDYLAAEDVLGQWLSERCVISHKIEFTKASYLYGNWKTWCDDGGLHAGSVKAFSQRLIERGFRSHKIGVMGFVGIGLRAESGHEPADGAGGKTPFREDREEGYILTVRRPLAPTHTHTSNKQASSPSSLNGHVNPNACIHCGEHCPPADTANSIPKSDGRWVHLECNVRAGGRA